jgi:glucosyl-3-phosphoglycerate synthase
VELASIIVIPARNEEQHIAACLRAIAAQTVPVSAFETILVLDGCTDRTQSVAIDVANAFELRMWVLEGKGGVGAARRAGMDAAAQRLLELGHADGLIATTDADSRPAPDWLERQLDHVGRGARVIAGLIELDEEVSGRLPSGVLQRRERDAALRLARLRELDPTAAHHHFAGASLGVTALVYRSVGGLEPIPVLEDAAFEARLREHRIPVLRAADVRVRTSARVQGRARRGLAVDMAVSTWSENRRYTASDFGWECLSQAKGPTSVTVIIPTKECASTIVGVLQHTVGPLARTGVVDEIVVIDAASVDGTAEIARRAGARVLQQDDVLPEHGPALGKGDAMWRAVHATGGDVVCFLDGDTADPDPRHLQGLLGPLLTDGSVQLVKGAFDRPLRMGGIDMEHEGGRVTELMARPLINLHEPRLAGFSQPLAGEFAARRGLLDSIPFVAGYGVEIGVLIDALRACGLDALAECQLGTRHNRHQPLRTLGEMAYAVLVAVENRREGRSGAAAGRYLRPWDDNSVSQVPVAERPPLNSLAASPGRALSGAAPALQRWESTHRGTG